jgi:hypothetical protein
MSSDYYGSIAGEMADDGYEPDDDWYDDDDRDDCPEPDGEDYEIARSYAEHYEHCERKHGGGECHCRPSPLLLAYSAVTRRLAAIWWWLRALPYRLRSPHTLRIGPLEMTLRVNPGRCGACGGQGWMYSKTGQPDLRPEGYDGVGLCGCGASIAKLAEARQIIRQINREAPF